MTAFGSKQAVVFVVLAALGAACTAGERSIPFGTGSTPNSGGGGTSSAIRDAAPTADRHAGGTDAGTAGNPDATGADAAGDAASDSSAGDDSSVESDGSATVGEGVVIEAEDYVAFFDTTAANQGGAYRTDAVDIETCSEGGYDVGWIVAGEWLEYQVDFQTSDTFSVLARVASPQGVSQGLRVLIDGRDVAGWITLAVTPSWQSWVDAPVGSIALDAGTHRIRIELNGGFNLDYLYVASTTHPPPERPRGNLPPPPERPSGYVGAVERFGRLQVIGTRLCDERGNPVVLRGVSSHGLQWFPLVAGYTVQNLAYTWGISVVRPAMYVEDYKNGEYWAGYLAHPDYMRAEVTEAVDDAVDASIYVLLDWHIHNDPMLFVTEATRYFTEMASRYGALPNVIYEICNEPEGVAWPRIKQYADVIVPAIRAIDPDNLIIVGTPTWCQTPDQAASDRLGYSNVLYAFHFYAGAHGQTERDSADRALAAGLPLFISEWGTSDYTGGTNGALFLAESATWMAWVRDRGLSWINWSFSNKAETSAALLPGVSLAGPWTDGEISASGQYVRQQLALP